LDKHELSERDICTKYILPALEKAGWDLQLQLREEFELAPGQIRVRGYRAVLQAQPADCRYRGQEQPAQWVKNGT